MATSAKAAKLKNSSAPVTSIAQRSGNGNEGLFDVIKTISSAAQKAAQYATEIAEFDKLIFEIKSLKADVAEKVEEIDRLEKRAEDKEKENQLLTDRFSTHTTKLRNDAEKCKTSLEAAKAEYRASSARHVQNVEKQTQEALEKEREKERKLRRTVAELENSKKTLERCQSEFDELRDHIGFISSDTDWPKSFKSLATHLHELAKNYFGIALPHPGRHDELFVSLYRSGFLNTIPHAIPISDTPESIALRIAAVESMVSKSLTKYMLHSLFPWSNSENSQSNMLEYILEGFLDINPRKEAILRTIISTSQLPDVQTREESAINLIVKEVTEKCAPILDLLQRDRTSTFRDSLMKYLKDTLQVWKDAQRSELRIVATSTIGDAVYGWGEQDEHQAEVTSNTPQDLSPQEPVVVLFPQVYQSEDHTVIHPGSALWADHRIYRLSKREYQAQYTRNRELLGSATSRRSRQIGVPRN